MLEAYPQKDLKQLLPLEGSYGGPGQMVLGVAGGKIWHPRVQETMHGAVKSKQSGLYIGMFGMTTYSCQGMEETFAP